MKTQTPNFKKSNAMSKAVLAGVVAIALTSGAAIASPEGSEKQMKPSIPFSKAMEIASATNNGEIVALELSHHEKSPVYMAELEGETSHTVLRIDGGSGKILATEKTSGTSAEELHSMLEQSHHQGGHGGHGADSSHSSGHGEGGHEHKDGNDSQPLTSNQ